MASKITDAHNVLGAYEAQGVAFGIGSSKLPTVVVNSLHFKDTRKVALEVLTALAVTYGEAADSVESRLVLDQDSGASRTYVLR